MAEQCAVAKMRGGVLVTPCDKTVTPANCNGCPFFDSGPGLPSPQSPVLADTSEIIPPHGHGEFEDYAARVRQTSPALVHDVDLVLKVAERHWTGLGWRRGNRSNGD